MIYCLDSNVFITAWNDNYPQNVFPTLYTEMERQLPGKIILIKPIFDEIDPVSSEDKKKSAEFLKKNYPLRFWLENKLKPHIVPIDNNVEKKARNLIKKYELKNKNTRGADHTDAKLVAYAFVHDHTVVTYEKKQPKSSGMKKHNYKIPLICEEEGAECITFVQLLEKCAIRV